jgi:tetratricopeptide (TPR) repeat protein
MQKLVRVGKKLADVEVSEGRFRESIGLLEQCLERLESCTENAQSSDDGLLAAVSVHSALSESYAGLADFRLGLAHRLETIRLLSEIESRSDKVLDRQMATAHLLAGRIFLGFRRYESGREHLEAAIQRLDRAAVAEPDNSHIQLVLWSTHSSLAQYYTHRAYVLPRQPDSQRSLDEDRAAVEKHFSRMLDAIDRLKELRPNDRTILCVSGITNGLLADVFAKRGELEKAVEFFGTACKFCEAYLSDDTPQLQGLAHLAELHTSRAKALRSIGRTDEAKTDLRAAREYIGSAMKIAAQQEVPNGFFLHLAKAIDDETAELDVPESAR